MSRLHIQEARGGADPLRDCTPADERIVLAERPFRNAISIERKRTERSGEPFLLMLVHTSGSDNAGDVNLLEKVASVLLQSSRETDIIGWYQDRRSLGALFTALVPDDRELIRATILARLSPLLENEMPAEEFNRIRISFHFLSRPLER